MRILQLHNFYKIAGGEDVVVANEASLLRSHGHEVDQLLVSNTDISNLAIRISTAVSVAYSTEMRSRVADWLGKKRPDIVHIHNTFPRLTPSVYDACIDAKVPVVQTLHNYRLGCINGLLLRNERPCEKCWDGSLYWGAVHSCYRGSRLGSVAAAYAMFKHRRLDTWNRKVSRFIALSKFARNKFIEFGIGAEKIIVKGNFAADLPTDEVPIEDHGLRRGALFVGRLSLEKGVISLVEAWNSLSYPLTIIGDGPLLDRVREMAGDHISIRGRQEAAQVRDEMRKAAFLVVPSICYEGFPMVIVEAFRTGLPVLGAAIGGISELLEQDGGRLFKPNSVSDLRRAAESLIESEDACRDLGVRARALYERLHTPEANYQKLMEIYEGVVSLPMSPPHATV